MIEMIVGHPHIFWLSLGGLLLGMAGCYLCRLNAACRLVLVEVDGETRS